MKICVIGGGSIGKRHLNNLNNLKLDLFCLKRSYSKTFEKKFNCKVITCQNEIISNNISSIVVCSPTSLHIDWIKFAYKFSLNIFIEKPLVSSQNQLSQIANLKFDNSVSFIGYMLRYHKPIIKIKEILKNNVLGNIYSAEFVFGSYLPDWPYKDYKSSYVSLKKLGGGVVNTISHEIDLIYYFFGQPLNVVSVNKNFNTIGIECEEINKSIAVYDDKLISLSLDLLTKEYRREIKIHGLDGFLTWNWKENFVRVKKYNNSKFEKVYQFDSSFDVNQLYIDEINDFIDKVKNREIKHELNFEYAKINMNLISKFKNEL